MKFAVKVLDLHRVSVKLSAAQEVKELIWPEANKYSHIHTQKIH